MVCSLLACQCVYLNSFTDTNVPDWLPITYLLWQYLCPDTLRMYVDINKIRLRARVRHVQTQSQRPRLLFWRTSQCWRERRHSRDSTAAHLCTQWEESDTAARLLWKASFVAEEMLTFHQAMIVHVTVNICQSRPGLWRLKKFLFFSPSEPTCLTRGLSSLLFLSPHFVLPAVCPLWTLTSDPWHQAGIFLPAVAALWMFSHFGSTFCKPWRRLLWWNSLSIGSLSDTCLTIFRLWT